MGIPDYDQVSKWLQLFGENVAVALVVVVAFAAIRPWIERRDRRLVPIFHGVLFGLSAIVSTTYPIPFAPGVLLDMRNVFVLVGSLAGGPIGAPIVLILTIAYRVYIGGPATVVGIGAILISAAAGLLPGWRLGGARARELGILPLMVVGFGAAILIHIWGRTMLMFNGLPPLPFEAVLATLVIYPIGTALLGVTVNTIRYSVWRQSQLESEAELQRRDEQLRISREHLALAQRIGKIGSIEVDIPTDTAIFSDEIYRLFGLPSGSAPSFERFLTAIHPDDRADIIADRHALARGETRAPREYRVVHPDGKVRWVFRQVEVFRDAAGHPQRHISTYVDITDRKQIEAALRLGEAELVSSREHLARAQAIAQIGSAEISLDGGQDQWSDELYRLLGIEPQSISAKFENFLPFVHPEDRVDLLRIRAITDTGELTEPSEFRIVRPNGDVRWVYRHSDKVYDHTGRAIKIIVSVQDIAERKRLDLELMEREAQLRRGREHLAQAQRVGMVGSAEVDLTTGKHVWSDELFRLFGLQPGAVVPGFERFQDFVHPDDRTVVAEAQEATRQGRVATQAEFRILRADGEQRWLRRQSDVVRDENGTATTIIVAFHDVTNSKSSATTLLDREERLRLNQDHLVIAQRIGRIGSAELDLETRATYWSDEHYRMLGIEPGEMPATAQTLLGFIHEDDREKMRAVFERARRGETTSEIEYRIIRRDGALRWIRRVQDIVSDATGKPVKLIATHQDITDRKASEDALHQREMQLLASQEHLSLAQRVGKVGSAEVDFTTGTSRWSDQLYALFGLSPSTPPSFESFLAILPQETHDLAFRIRAQELRGVPSPPRELTIVRPDGEQRLLYRVVEMIPGEGGRPKGMITTYQDITDIRRMEEQLQVSREHLARAQRIGRIGSAEVDLQTRRVYWSDGMYDLLGLEQSVSPGRDSFLNAVHPEDRILVTNHRALALHGGTTPPLEFRIIRPDGSLRWIYHKVEAVLGPDGRPQKLIGIDQDVTDRKLAMLELDERDHQYRDSQKHLALAQRVGKIGSVEIDRVTGVSRWSDEMFALLGLDPATSPPGEATLVSVIHPDDRALVAERRARLLRDERNVPGEFRIIRADTGELRWMHVQSGPSADPSSDTVVGTFQDITDLKLAQQQREEIERQLMQAQKMEAVGNLTGGIAHDFNNLLNVILGRLDLIENELADRPQLREWVQICAAAARKGASLTRNMMAFARQQPLRPTAIELDDSIREMVRILQRSLSDAIEIKVVCEEGLWVCEADPAQLQSALLNLALNARDAMLDGGKLTIDAHNGKIDAEYAMRNADAMPGDYVVLAVTDTGTGMPQDVIDHAFEPFFTTKEVGKGSGLGLSMVYGFARQSGGHVKIYSEVGHGTTIRLYLPRAIKIEDAVAELEAQAAAPPPPSSVPINGHETIMVVEDDEDMRDLTVAVLERLGYGVLSAREAESAIPLFDAHPEISLLLTDISLPGGMNGRRLAEQFLAKRPALKVLYMSGYSEDAIIHQGRLDPGVRLLQKPFQNEDLAFQVRAALGDD